MPSPLRVAVLGLSHDHVWDNLRLLTRENSADVVAASDPNPVLLRKFGEYSPAQTYESHLRLLDSERLDGVYIFSNNRDGAELAVEAAARGLHILIEKPMADSLVNADRMLMAARQSDVHLVVNWPFAWWPQLQHALWAVSEGIVGDVWQVKYRAAHAGPRELGCSDAFCDWLFDPQKNGGGALMDYACYGAVLARAVMGLPSRVTAVTGRFRKEDILVEDNALVVMTYPHGMATAEASWTQIGKLTAYTTAIYGSHGTLMVEPRQGGRLLLATESDPEGSPIDIPDAPPELANAASHFCRIIQNETTPWILCQDRISRDAQEILEAGRRSAQSGREISLPLSLS